MDLLMKDPVCGMQVRPDSGVAASHGGTQYFFCSDFCRQSFLSDPGRYGAAPSAGETREVRRIAYFSMEVGVASGMPTYSGGLGVLAGDTLKSAADLKVPMVAVSLLYRKGHFEQTLDEWGNQQERPASWDPADFARPLPATVRVTIEGRPVVVRAWQYDVVGSGGYVVPLVLLDTSGAENDPGDRELTDWLYGGDRRYRLAQETVLGLGGVRMLRALGHDRLERFHLNEGHAGLLLLELLGETAGGREAGRWDFDSVRSRCVFTTHTPVPAGHDEFSYDLVQRVLGEPLPLDALRMLAGPDRLDLTRLSLNMCRFINGVAKRHREVSHEMFPDYPIDAVTNGVHSGSWVSEEFRAVFDRHIPGWADDPASFRYAVRIPKDEVWRAHVGAKGRLLDRVRHETGQAFAPDRLTIGFARRATQYKRGDLVFSDLGQLREIARAAGPIQFVFAGKAHPQDFGGKEMIRRIFDAARQLNGDVEVAYLANYDMDLAGLLTAGVDLWLNTPLRPLEASGTSGMKAAHNGVPSLSVLDGWWIEGHLEGVTGWSIGPGPSDAAGQRDPNEDAQELYRKLRTVISPLYHGDRDRWVDVMRHAIAFNASFFNTHRMVQQYAAKAYL